MSDLNPSEAQEDSFISHLVELRDRLIRAVFALVVIFGLLAFFIGTENIYTFLAQPLLNELPKGGSMINTDIVGMFMVPLKVTMAAAFLIALPYVLYQIWAFVAPGLYQHEKRLAFPLLIASVLLFFIGMAFAYYLVFPAVFHFMSGIAPKGVAWMTDIDKYFSFVITTFIAFGIAFEVPVVVILLVKIGIVDIAKLKEIRPYVILAAFIVGAIFTPPDIISQFMLAVPMCLLYEAGILVARFISRPAKPDDNTEDDSDIMSDDEINRALATAEEAHRRQKG
ncbi:MAG: twin-arginine translocase subunit TatC [Zoogloeaceae bacterium]|jgi:sec-independent protein translocase protein TatC|nr:twin-arginine translocase subunit TatC [Zoogloeaceae bacterium]